MQGHMAAVWWSLICSNSYVKRNLPQAGQVAIVARAKKYSGDEFSADLKKWYLTLIRLIYESAIPPEEITWAKYHLRAAALINNATYQERTSSTPTKKRHRRWTVSPYMARDARSGEISHRPRACRGDNGRCSLRCRIQGAPFLVSFKEHRQGFWTRRK